MILRTPVVVMRSLRMTAVTASPQSTISGMSIAARTSQQAGATKRDSYVWLSTGAWRIELVRALTSPHAMLLAIGGRSS